MAYSIELISTKEDLLPFLEAAIQPLNKIQKEFSYHLATPRIQQKVRLFDQGTYTTTEVFKFLADLKAEEKGNRPYTILFIEKPLSGAKTNLFGSHHAKDGFAVVTTDLFDPKVEQFIHNIIRYIRYYIARYTLSFLNPMIKSHPTKGCMFDDKVNKRSILLSLTTGEICVDCQKLMTPTYSPETKSAIENILEVVSNQHPLALVMKGGGVKGLAFAGAIKVLEEHFTFDVFAGTSAGAITATLLGCGYKPEEILDILNKKDFNDFKDKSFKQILKNILFNTSLYSGQHFMDWLTGLIIRKVTHKEGFILMKDLPHRTIMYASMIGEGVVRFDSNGQRSDTQVAFAARCSMSIPGFFVPPKIEGIKVLDGGLGNNFPLRRFISDNPSKLFIGLYLISEIMPKGTLFNNLMDIITDADEREVVNQNIDKIVRINPYPINTKQFDIGDKEKKFLVKCGKVGALKFLIDHHKDIEVNLAEYQLLVKEVEVERSELVRLASYI